MKYRYIRYDVCKVDYVEVFLEDSWSIFGR
jgi:hypothetical protein